MTRKKSRLSLNLYKGKKRSKPTPSLFKSPQKGKEDYRPPLEKKDMTSHPPLYTEVSLFVFSSPGLKLIVTQRRVNLFQLPDEAEDDEDIAMTFSALQDDDAG